MAEAAVAGRLCGERERAMRITRRALDLLADGDDPLRAAWFWVQRSMLTEGLARGDGWKELATAQDLVRGLPPSEVHAEVLSRVACWSMLHAPGPDALSDAQRAVEYAHMVGAEDIELNARLTLGGLMVDAGDVETGIAEMEEVRRRTLERGHPAAVLGRAYVNVPSCLEGIGRSQDAVRLLREGIEVTGRMGLLESEAWVWGNLAESLLSLGRWDEALEAVEKAQIVGSSHKPRGLSSLICSAVAVARGDTPEARRQVAIAHGHYGSHNPMPQNNLPLSALAIGVAATEGRLPDARTELARVLDTGFPVGTQRYAWPLLLTAATAEADARVLPATGPGRAEVLDRIFTAVRKLTTGAPIWLAHEQWVRAELQRAEGVSDPDTWSDVVTAFEPLERPYDLARVRHRLAEALLADGADDEARDRATELLRLAAAVADHLGARPLADEVALLARRARLTLRRGPEPALTPADPVAALGLTGREHDVLRLVAAGRTNRQIAEELFISPKTASVHVSNILAKLGVSGRGEAAAVAHRLGLFPTGAGERLAAG